MNCTNSQHHPTVIFFMGFSSWALKPGGNPQWILLLVSSKRWDVSTLQNPCTENFHGGQRRRSKLLHFSTIISIFWWVLLLMLLPKTFCKINGIIRELLNLTTYILCHTILMRIIIGKTNCAIISKYLLIPAPDRRRLLVNATTSIMHFLSRSILNKTDVMINESGQSTA